MMQQAVYPVDTHVGEEQETDNAQDHSSPAWNRDNPCSHTSLRLDKEKVMFFFTLNQSFYEPWPGF